MVHRVLGRTDLPTSPLALGTAHFGWRTGAPESAALLDSFRAHGGNLIEVSSVWCRDPDTAELVALPSEDHVGRWLHSRNVPRHEIVLACRVLLDASLAGDPALAEHLRANCESTLRRLRTSHLDVLLVEWDDSLLPLERLAEALWPLVWRGWVFHVGASGFPAWRVAAGNALARQHNLPPFAVVRAPFSLLDPRRFELEYSSLCDSHRLGFLAHAPLAASELARKLPTEPRGTFGLRPTGLAGAVRDRLALVARQRGVRPAQVELAWVLAHGAVSAAVVEPVSVAEFLRLHTAAQWRLGAEERRLLREPWTPAGHPRGGAAAPTRAAPAARLPTLVGEPQS